MDEIRKAGPKDHASIYEIYTYYVENSSAIFEITPRPFEDLQKEWQHIQETYPFYVAVHDQEVIGYAYIHEAFTREAYRYCTELSIYFKPGRHYGLAKDLLETIEEEAKAMQVKWIISCITDSNEASLKFHTEHGYRLQGALPESGKKFDTWHGVVWMCKNLYESEKPYRIAKNATIVGDVALSKDCSVWYGAVLRGDVAKIQIGEGTNVQDQCTLHVDAKYPLSIGKNCTIGHNAIVHGAMIEEEVMVGMGAIVMNGAYIEKHCILAAGTVVLENMHIPEGSLVAGIPARIVKFCSLEQIESIQRNAEHYIERSKKQL